MNQVVRTEPANSAWPHRHAVQAAGPSAPDPMALEAGNAGQERLLTPDSATTGNRGLLTPGGLVVGRAVSRPSVGMEAEA